jgi:hypothetical protein
MFMQTEICLDEKAGVRYRSSKAVSVSRRVLRISTTLSRQSRPLRRYDHSPLFHTPFLLQFTPSISNRFFTLGQKWLLPQLTVRGGGFLLSGLLFLGLLVVYVLSTYPFGMTDVKPE